MGLSCVCYGECAVFSCIEPPAVFTATYTKCRSLYCSDIVEVLCICSDSGENFKCCLFGHHLSSVSLVSELDVICRPMFKP
jgi:hypothetical protein